MNVSNNTLCCCYLLSQLDIHNQRNYTDKGHKIELYDSPENSLKILSQKLIRIFFNVRHLEMSIINILYMYVINIALWHSLDLLIY